MIIVNFFITLTYENRLSHTIYKIKRLKTSKVDEEPTSILDIYTNIIFLKRTTLKYDKT